MCVTCESVVFGLVRCRCGNNEHVNIIQQYLVAVIGPATKLHVTVLVIKGEPRNVYLACALEDTGRDVQAAAVMSDHNVCLESPVETLIST